MTGHPNRTVRFPSVRPPASHSSRCRSFFTAEFEARRRCVFSRLIGGFRCCKSQAKAGTSVLQRHWGNRRLRVVTHAPRVPARMLLKSGDHDAAAPIWDKYFSRLLGLARRKLASGANRVADEEDVALSAFNSFCKGAAAGRFAQLDDRDDLWQVLAMIISRKAGRQLERERALKRGGGKIRGESVFFVSGEERESAGLQQRPGTGPAPDVAVMLEESLGHLLDELGDESLREVAVMKLEGYANTEIAERVGRNVRSVERKLQLIRKQWTTE